jgi:Na+-translocating ferredoxin:NAD+ oxidoreductase RnfD subunit
MSEPMLLAGTGAVGTLAAIGIGGIIFLKQKQGYWETPVLFMAICFICEALFGGKEMPLAFFSGVLFTACFLLADPVTLPLTRKGTTVFVLGAALLSSRIIPSFFLLFQNSSLDCPDFNLVKIRKGWNCPEGFSIGAACFAVLLMNLLAPWLDIWLKPAPYKAKNFTKTTYPS